VSNDISITATTTSIDKQHTDSPIPLLYFNTSPKLPIH
jgi:hypothetical protein